MEKSTASSRLSFHRTGPRCSTFFYVHGDVDDDEKGEYEEDEEDDVDEDGEEEIEGGDEDEDEG